MLKVQCFKKYFSVFTLSLFVLSGSYPHICGAAEAYGMETPSPVPVKTKDQNKSVKVKDENKKSNDSLIEPSPLAAAEFSASETANPDANEDAKALLAYFSGLPEKGEDKVVSGQFVGHASTPSSNFMAENYQKLVKDLEESTGQSIGVIGVDYEQLSENNPVVDLSLTNQPLIDAWENGAIPTISWHARNPWTGLNARDTDIDGKFLDVLKAGTTVNTAYMEDLDRVADALLELQQAGVTVLWRPFHESTSQAFWWSKGSSSDFKKLWQHMFKYFTEKKGLNNLLWVYSVAPKTKYNPERKAEDANYPGPQYVDMTGLDIYADSLKNFIGSYQKLKKLNKPFALTEYGPYKASDAKENPELLEPHFPYDKLADEIRAYMPDTVFFQAWNHGHSLSGQLNAGDLLSDPWITDARDWK